MAALLVPHTDNIQKPANSPDCLVGEVSQLCESRLHETVLTVGQPFYSQSTSQCRDGDCVIRRKFKSLVVFSPNLVLIAVIRCGVHTT